MIRESFVEILCSKTLHREKFYYRYTDIPQNVLCSLNFCEFFCGDEKCKTCAEAAKNFIRNKIPNVEFV